MSDAIGRAGNWRVQLVEVGSGRHPGSWVGPTYPKWYWSPINVVVLRAPEETVLVDCGPGVTSSWWPFDGFRSDTQGALADAGVTPEDVDLVEAHLDPFNQRSEDGTLACHRQLEPVLADLCSPREKPLLH